MKGKICLVTGANAGIGLETARGLAASGATVVMACRSVERGQAAVDDVRAATGSDAVELLQLDLASGEAIRAAAEGFLARHDQLHVLINNAGLILDERRETADGFEATFGVNHLGPFLLTWLLKGALARAAPARVVNLSSTAHRGSRGLDFDDLMYARRRYSGLGVYADSKLANILFTRELARRLEGAGVTTYAVHPGVVNTRFGKDGDTRGLFARLIELGGPLLMTPAKGARTSLYAATEPKLASHTGRYYQRSREARPTRYGRDDDAARRLWEVSAALWGLDPEGR